MNNFSAQIFVFKLHQSNRIFRREKQSAFFFKQIIIRKMIMSEMDLIKT